MPWVDAKLIIKSKIRIGIHIYLLKNVSRLMHKSFQPYFKHIVCNLCTEDKEYDKLWEHVYDFTKELFRRFEIRFTYRQRIIFSNIHKTWEVDIKVKENNKTKESKTQWHLPLHPCPYKMPLSHKQHKHGKYNLEICAHPRNTCELLQHLPFFLKIE